MPRSWTSGLARLSDHSFLTADGATVGTVAYMSPEQSTGEVVDHRTDIWALGILLYELVTGAFPFYADFQPAIVYQILNAEPRPLSQFLEQVPAGLQQVIDGALAKKVGERFQSAAEFIEAIDDVALAEEAGTPPLAQIQRQETGDRKAYEYYARARHRANQMSSKNFEEVKKLYEKALALKSCCLHTAFLQTECAEAPLVIMTAKNHNPWTIGWFAALLVVGSVAGPTLEPRTVTADSIWAPPVSEAAKEFVTERDRMVLTQIERPPDYRDPVSNLLVLQAMRSVPRHVFVPAKLEKKAYNDTPLPIGHGQTISQPYIVAVMTELLRIGRESKVLEIGTGSGYQAAVLAHLTPHVFTIEIIEALAASAHDALRTYGYGDVEVRRADGYYGWESQAPFDAIIVTCAAGHLPPPLWDQLKPGGRIVIPIGGTFSVQRLVVVEKTKDGKRKSDTVMSVRFVPMTGSAQDVKAR